jgi:hypothetical protein
VEFGERRPDQDGAFAVDLRAGRKRQIDEASVAISSGARALDAVTDAQRK